VNERSHLGRRSRELTNHAPELFALRSLGDEVLSHGPGGGYSWLQEHLGDDYIAAWHVPEIRDAAVVNSGEQNFSTALAAKAPVHVGKILSSDSFYTEDPDQWKLWAKFGVLGVEMETAELYTLAAKYDVEALAILTVSDHLVTHEATPAEERETRFRAMAEIAFQALLAK